MFPKQRLYTLALVSLILSLIFLIIVLSVIDPGVAMSVFAVSVAICEIIRYAQPQRIDQFLSTWGNMSNLVHWGIISVFLLSVFYYLFYFLRSFKIDFNIIPKESNE